MAEAESREKVNCDRDSDVEIGRWRCVEAGVVEGREEAAPMQAVGRRGGGGADWRQPWIWAARA